MKAVQLNLVRLTAGPNLQYDWIRTDWDVQLIVTTAVQLAFSFLLWDLLLLRGNSSFSKFINSSPISLLGSFVCDVLFADDGWAIFLSWWDWCCSSNFLMEFKNWIHNGWIWNLSGFERGGGIALLAGGGPHLSLHKSTGQIVTPTSRSTICPAPHQNVDLARITTHCPSYTKNPIFWSYI